MFKDTETSLLVTCGGRGLRMFQWSFGWDLAEGIPGTCPHRPVPLDRPGGKSRREISNEAANFVRSLAHARARSTPVDLKQATVAASVQGFHRPCPKPGSGQVHLSETPSAKASGMPCFSMPLNESNITSV